MLDQMCKVITVDRSELPSGHDFVIIARERDVLVFAAPDDQAQLEARAAFFAWDHERNDERRLLGAFN